jgi:hypothetical protein
VLTIKVKIKAALCEVCQSSQEDKELTKDQEEEQGST